MPDNPSRPKTPRPPPLLEVRDLSVSFDVAGIRQTVVSNVSWSAERGKTTAIVGESGCGKSATALAIMRLLPHPGSHITGGPILFRDDPEREAVNLLDLAEPDMRRIRGNRISMIFQEPMNALNPVMRVGDQIGEALEVHGKANRRQAREAAVELLTAVGISAAPQRARAYPHELSGGMRQRVMIAMALACKPAVLIADEPTTALDVTVQAQILALLADLQSKFGMGLVIITHDLGVVAQLADTVCVMYAGRIVEAAPVKSLFADPLHPYTRALLESRPPMTGARRPLRAIPGRVPDPAHFPPGCRFHPRCPLTRTLAAESPHLAVAIDDDAGNPIRVLRRCTESPSRGDADPFTLRPRSPGHFVACPETHPQDTAVLAGKGPRQTNAGQPPAADQTAPSTPQSTRDQQDTRS